MLELLRRLEKSGFEGRTLTLKVKFADFRQITRSTTASKVLRTKEDILPLAKQLMHGVAVSHDHPVRLLGLGISHSAADMLEEESQPTAEEWTELELPFEPWPDE